MLLDATAVPADRGGVGRYVDGLIGALGAAGADLAVVCQRVRRRALRAGSHRRADGRRRARRHRAPPGPAGLGADRPAAGRPAGRGRGHPLAALHDAAARAGARRGHRARRDVLHRARAAHRGQGHASSAPRPAPRCAGPPGSSCRRKATRDELVRLLDADPTRIDVAYHGVDTAHLPRRRPRPRRGRVADPARPARPALHRLPRRARAAQERPRPDPRLGPGRRRTCDDPPALVLAGGSGWDDERRPGDRRGAAATCGSCAPATCAPADLPGCSAARPSSPTRARRRASACRCSRRWPAAPPVLTTPRLSLPEVGGDAVAYTEPDADEHRRPRCARCSTTRSAGRMLAEAGRTRGPASSPGRPRPRRTSRPTRGPPAGVPRPLTQP